MKKHNIEWLRQRFAKKLSSKVWVLEEVAAYLIAKGRKDLLGKLAATGGDGVKIVEDRFTFCGLGPTGQAPLRHPLGAIAPLYSVYVCKLADVHSVYEDEEGQAVVIVKAPPIAGEATETNGQANG
jgi:hypothetical protein